MKTAPAADRPSAARVLIVEDDAALRDLLTGDLADRGYTPTSVTAVADALAALDHAAPDLILTDLKLPDGSGMDLLPAARRHRERPATVLITAFGSVPQAVAALKAGADDFLTKPFDLEHLAVRIERALEQRRTHVTLEHLRATLRESGHDELFRGMVGRSPVMQHLFSSISRVARVDDPVLVTGESGTGKELVARAIHAESPRAARPFVAVNCGAIPETLLEAEFFGHAANAFTGAGTARPGLFADADGGTLFLDEVGEMPHTLQVKLLRVLQEGRIRPLGFSDERDVDVRIIAATNRDLEADVQAGRWRDDLYYRLETLRLDVPPLRRRGAEDRLAIIGHVLAQQAAQRNLPRLNLTEAALALLQAYEFPGNVRELANALTRAATFCEQGTIEARHLPARLRAAPQAARPADGDPLRLGDGAMPTLAQVEARYIRWVLDRTNQNKRRAAQILNVGRRTLYRKLEQTVE